MSRYIIVDKEFYKDNYDLHEYIYGVSSDLNGIKSLLEELICGGNGIVPYEIWETKVLFTSIEVLPKEFILK